MSKKSHTSTIFISFVFLVVFGLFVLASASYFVSCQKFNDCYYYLKHQVFYSLPIAVGAFLFFYFFNYKYLKKFSLIIFLASLVLMALVFVPGLSQTKGAANCWINIFGINFQPSEIAKIGFVIYLAAFFSAKKEKIRKLTDGLLPVLFIIGFVMIFFVLQSDMGMLLLYALVGFLLYFLADSNFFHIIIVVLLMTILGGFLALNVPYIKERFTVFLNPDQNISDDAFQINQAKTAIISGGVFGKGLGKSSQKFNVLPEVVSDSIFPVFAEEMGFIWSFILIFVYAFLTYQIFVLANDAPDKFGFYLCSGLGFFFIIQMIVNISGNLGLIPLTGVPLPFLGYGGSNLLFLFSAFGIILNVSKQVDSNK